MIQHILRFGTGVAFLIVLLSPSAAQEKQPLPKEKGPPGAGGAKDGLDEYRQYFKKPETADEYWKAFQFEIDVGQYPLAARLLHGLVTKPPTDDELLALEAKYGLAAFLKLRTLPPLRERGQDVPRWSDDPKVQKQTLDDIEQLIKLVTAAVKKKLADRERIIKWVRALNSAPEEAAFALKELYAYRALAVPPLIDELRVAQDDDRRTLRKALVKLSADVVPPLVAALDSNDPDLIVDVIGVFMHRAAKETVPNLWYLSASPTHSERVRAKATAALAYFLDVPVSKLPPAKVALTREAERYYQHQVAFPDPRGVVVWRWDKNGLVKGWPGAETVPADQGRGILRTALRSPGARARSNVSAGTGDFVEPRAGKGAGKRRFVATTGESRASGARVVGGQQSRRAHRRPRTRSDGEAFDDCAGVRPCSGRVGGSAGEPADRPRRTVAGARPGLR